MGQPESIYKPIIMTKGYFMKKFLSVILVLSVLFLLSSCKDVSNSSDKNEATNLTDVNGNVIASKTEYEKYYDSALVTKVVSSCKRTKIDYYDFNTEKYGLISLDGTKDTGPKYYNISTTGYYYFAKTKPIGAANDLDSINSYDLIDSDTKVLTGGFCWATQITYRFMLLAKVVGLNTNGDSDFDFETTEGKCSYDAEFYIYDLINNKVLDNVKANDHLDINAFGPVVRITVGEKSYKYISADGYSFPSDAKFITDFYGYMHTCLNEKESECYYKIEADDVGAVYNSKNQKVYSYVYGEKYTPSSYDDGYFSVWKYNENRDIVHNFLDLSFKPTMHDLGHKGSTIYTQSGTNMFFDRDSQGDTKQYIYDYNGNVVFSFESALNNKTGNSNLYWSEYNLILSDYNDVIIIDKNHNVIYNAEGNGTETFDSTSLSASKIINDEKYYFCVKDKDFTINVKDSQSIGPYLVEIEEENGTKSIIDLITGKTVISGYYEYYTRRMGLDMYISAAYNDGSSDIYLIDR